VDRVEDITVAARGWKRGQNNNCKRTLKENCKETVNGIETAREKELHKHYRWTELQ
jgi:hypothetical protein